MARIGAFEAVLAIALVALVMLLFVAVTMPGPEKQWQLSAGQRVVGASVGGDGTLYAILGDPLYIPEVAVGGAESLQAITRDGETSWNLAFSDLLDPVHSVENKYTASIAATSGDVLYLFLTDYYSEAVDSSNGCMISHGFYDKLFAIDRAGDVLWNRSIGRHYSASSYQPDAMALEAIGGRLYLRVGPEVTVMDENGTGLWSIDNVAGQVAVGPDGCVFAVGAEHVNPYPNGPWGYDRWDPTTMVYAYYPNGTLFWSHDLRQRVDSMSQIPTPMEDFEDSSYQALPLYNNGTLYLPVGDGIVALDRYGNELWSRHFGEGQANVEIALYDTMPFDSAGNVYLIQRDSAAGYGIVYAISPDGTNVTARDNNLAPEDTILATRAETAYYTSDLPTIGSYYLHLPGGVTIYMPGPTDDLRNLSTVTIGAKDLVAGRDRWSYRVPADNSTIVTITTDNADMIFPPGMVPYIRSMNLYDSRPGTAEYGIFNRTPVTIQSAVGISVLPSRDVTYVNFYTYNYEDPVALGRSRCNYYGGIFALDSAGRLLWQKQTDGYVYWMTTDDRMVYYGTSNGRLSNANAYLAGGVTLATIFYFLSRFVLAGTVARARNRLDKNENRNGVMRYIIDNPGLTARDIARGLGVNLGTVRYHLLILGLNHRIISCQADRKHVRYFTNSNTYGKDEQLLLSLVRRDGFRKVLKLLADNRRMSNQELSRALDMRESAVSRYTKELMGCGIVARERTGEGNMVYSIKDDRVEPVALAMRRID